MSEQTTRFGTDSRLLSLLDPNTIGQILNTYAGIDWPDDDTAREVRVERAWPTRNGRFVFEWSFKLNGNERFSLFAETGASSQTCPKPRAAQAEVTHQGIGGVRVQVPDWDISVFSPDRDAGMPHLTRCLDETEMARHLAPHWPGSTANATSPIICRPLGYRAGKRAAIAFDLTPSGAAPSRLLGKTFCDDRAEKLHRRHETLGAQLSSSTDGRVGTTKAIGLLPDLHMVLFAWRDTPVLPCRTHAMAGADAMVALHQTDIADLPVFSVDDECRVVTRWHAALSRLAPPLAEATAPIVEALQDAARSLDGCHVCTVHRDFYERQFIHDGTTTTLLDLDTLARGDPAVDLGNYLTHFVLGEADLDDPPENNAAKPELLVRHYLAGGGELNRRSLAFYWASSLLRVGSVHAVRDRTKAYSPFLWNLASDVLCCVGYRVAFRAPSQRIVSGLPDARSVLEEVPV